MSPPIAFIFTLSFAVFGEEWESQAADSLDAAKEQATKEFENVLDQFNGTVIDISKNAYNTTSSTLDEIDKWLEEK